MHELSIAQSIVAQVVKLINKNTAKTVEVEVGEMSGVDPDALSFAFPMAVEGTPIAGVKLKIRKSPFRIRCPRCRKSFNMGETPFHLCPQCGSVDVKVLSGRELLIKRIVMTNGNKSVKGG